jgi:hypothetical protein
MNLAANIKKKIDLPEPSGGDPDRDLSGFQFV